jgi:hypothetical protein
MNIFYWFLQELFISYGLERKLIKKIKLENQRSKVKKISEDGA